MYRPQVYLDTTVPSAYLDSRAPERQRLTQEFWNDRLPAYEGVISSLVMAEINGTPDEARRDELERLVKNCQVVAFTEEADRLAQEYVTRGIFPEKYVADANHVAAAVVHGIGYLASWNFKHLVKVKTRREVNLVNSLNGYGVIEIVAPPEL